MAYIYKYIPSSLELAGKNPKTQYTELFQQTLTNQFYNGSDWWTIQEESANGSEIYKDIDVRITHLINAETGLKMGDDWKTVLFKEIDHSIELGKRYIFDNNTWLTINTEFIKNLTGTCTIRRCNNTLRWIDEATGAYYEEPCCIEYLVKEPRDYATGGSPFITPGGFLHIEMQFNDRSNKIKQNQRFLFGNPGHWSCYKVVGTGINDFRNNQTYSNDSAKILVLDLVANFVNDELDDIVNGIADVYTNNYTVTLNKTSVSGKVGDTVQLIANTTYNGDTTSRTMTWESSNDLIATVSASGGVNLIKVGNCVITTAIKDNPTSASCEIIVTTSGSSYTDTQVIISPTTNYILESASAIYSVYLYENGAKLANTFTITCNPNTVPSANYTFSQTDGNHFSIINKLRDLNSYLTITCISGINTKTINISLRGGWLNDNI
jgi:hypothetical protein